MALLACTEFLEARDSRYFLAVCIKGQREQGYSAWWSGEASLRVSPFLLEKVGAVETDG